MKITMRWRDGGVEHRMSATVRDRRGALRAGRAHAARVHVAVRCWTARSSPMLVAVAAPPFSMQSFARALNEAHDWMRRVLADLPLAISETFATAQWLRSPIGRGFLAGRTEGL